MAVVSFGLWNQGSQWMFLDRTPSVQVVVLSGINCQLHPYMQWTCWYILARIYYDINSFSYVNDCPSNQLLLTTLYIAPVVNDLTTGSFSVAEITVVIIQHFSSINWYRGHTWHTVQINRWFAFQDFQVLYAIVRNRNSSAILICEYVMVDFLWLRVTGWLI